MSFLIITFVNTMLWLTRNVKENFLLWYMGVRRGSEGERGYEQEECYSELSKLFFLLSMFNGGMVVLKL